MNAFDPLQSLLANAGMGAGSASQQALYAQLQQQFQPQQTQQHPLVSLSFLFDLTDLYTNAVLMYSSCCYNRFSTKTPSSTQPSPPQSASPPSQELSNGR
jgi:hypothetical protein